MLVSKTLQDVNAELPKIVDSIFYGRGIVKRGDMIVINTVKEEIL